jgi:glycosyltransferase involved in cell wall biosynthesis
MRIAVITTHILPITGGIEVHCENLSLALSEAGHDVVLFGSLEQDQSLTERWEVIGERFQVRRIPTIHRPLIKRALRLYNLLRQISRDHQRQPFDVIHAHQLYPVSVAAAIAAKRLRCQLVVTEHGSILDDSASIWKRILIRWAARTALHVIAASRELAETVIAAGVPSEKVLSIPNAIWPKQFNLTIGKHAARTALGIPADAFLLMTVRRLVPKTGIQYAIRAIPHCIQKIPYLHLAVVGDGPLKEKLEALAAQLGIADHVTFLGAVSNTEVPRCMAAADVGLFPSLAEATSIAALEFMAAGIPVVSSTVGGLPEVIDDGRSGFLVDFGFRRSTYQDPGLSSEAIEALSDGILRAHRSNLRTLGETAQRLVHDRFSWPAYIRRLHDEVYPREA